jgi:hypothetical protein
MATSIENVRTETTEAVLIDPPFLSEADRANLKKRMQKTKQLDQKLTPSRRRRWLTSDERARAQRAANKPPLDSVPN